MVAAAAMAAAATAATSWPSVTADDGKSTAAASSGATGVHKPVASSTMWSRVLPQAVVDCALPSAWQPDPVVPDYVEDLFLLRASASNSKAFMSADRLQAVLRVNDVDAESGKWTAAEGGSQQGSATLCKRVRGDTQYALGVAADGSTIKLMRRRTHSKERARENDVVAPTPPPHTLFSGFALQALGGGDAAGAAQVDVDEAASGSADNILGDNAVFVVTDAAGSSPRDLLVRIPVAAPTRANFAFYGAVLVPGLQLTPELLAQGDVDSWGALTPQDVPKAQREALALYKPSSCEGDETPEDAWFTLQGEGGVMPVFGMDVGSEYFVEYLQRDEPGRHGSGVYIENHTTPHLHIPANKDAG